MSIFVAISVDNKRKHLEGFDVSDKVWHSLHLFALFNRKCQLWARQTCWPPLSAVDGSSSLYMVVLYLQTTRSGKEQVMVLYSMFCMVYLFSNQHYFNNAPNLSLFLYYDYKWIYGVWYVRVLSRLVWYDIVWYSMVCMIPLQLTLRMKLVSKALRQKRRCWTFSKIFNDVCHNL